MGDDDDRGDEPRGGGKHLSRIARCGDRGALFIALSATQSACAAGLEETTAGVVQAHGVWCAGHPRSTEQRNDAHSGGEIDAARTAGEALRNEVAAIAMAQLAHLAALMRRGARRGSCCDSRAASLRGIRFSRGGGEGRSERGAGARRR